MKTMIEEELGRTKEKEMEEKRKKETKDFLKRWEANGLVIKKKEGRIKVKEWGKEWQKKLFIITINLSKKT